MQNVTAGKLPFKGYTVGEAGLATFSHSTFLQTGLAVSISGSAS